MTVRCEFVMPKGRECVLPASGRVFFDCGCGTWDSVFYCDRHERPTMEQLRASGLRVGERRKWPAKLAGPDRPASSGVPDQAGELRPQEARVKPLGPGLTRDGAVAPAHTP